MARGQVFSIIGLPKVQRAVKKLPSFIADLTASVIIETVDNKVIPKAMELAPKDTGDMAGSIRREPAKLRETRKLVVADIKVGGVPGPKRGKIIDYAATVHQTHPTQSLFLQRAVLEEFPKLPGVYRRTWRQKADGRTLR